MFDQRGTNAISTGNPATASALPFLRLNVFPIYCAASGTRSDVICWPPFPLKYTKEKGQKRKS
jgi:hypothetical protein